MYCTGKIENNTDMEIFGVYVDSRREGLFMRRW